MPLPKEQHKYTVDDILAFTRWSACRINRRTDI